MRRRVMGMVGVVAVVVLWLGPGGPAAAKSFRVAGVQVDAVLNTDGSMRVVERITYDFDGHFQNGFRPIPPGDYQIVDVTVSEAGRAVPTTGAPYNLSWRYDALNERRTFEISYTVLGAAKVGPDVGELYWKWVGSDHPGVGVVSAILTVPGDGAGVRAWGHGPLHGGVELRGNQILWSVQQLPAGQFMEGRVAVPGTAFAVAPSGGDRLPRILREEQAWADAANAERERAEQLDRLRDALVTLFPLAPIAGWAVFLFAWLRWGREHNPPVDVGQYLREPPDDPPALVPTLLKFGTVPPVAFAATIIDLAQRGFLTIEEISVDRTFLPDKTDWILRWKQPPEAVRPFERHVLDRLFETGTEVRHSEFVARLKANRTEADRWWDRFTEMVGREFKARSWMEGGKGPAYALNIAAAIAVIIAGLAVLGGARHPIGIAGIVSGGIQAVATATLRRRTPAGAQRAAEWEAVERFLRDFSQLEEAPVGHLVLWERYLVYAVALGVSEEVARAMALRLPAPVGADDGGFAPWYISHGGIPAGSFARLDSFSRDFGPVVMAAARPPSSSSSGSGGGGGFSGGGGGGGGGGGIGAS